MLKILSLNNNQVITQEAELLRSLAENHKEKLFNFKCGQKTIIEGKSFYCFSSDKNIIFKVKGDFSWFLKYSLKEVWVEHEIAGAESVIETLADFDGYYKTTVFAASRKEKFTLCSAIYGNSFNIILLQACLLRSLKLPTSICLTMENLGKSLGRLHCYSNPSQKKVLNPDTFFYIKNYLKNIKKSDDIIQHVEQWVDKQAEYPFPTAWIHGNVKSEDILFVNNQVSILDFGTCGKGVPFEDLTNLCAYMMLLRTVPLFPWRIARSAMSALLNGYVSEYKCNKDEMLSYITLGIFRYYLKNVVMHSGFSTLSGMPVLKSRIDTLVLQLLHNNHEAAFEGVF